MTTLTIEEVLLTHCILMAERSQVNLGLHDPLRLQSAIERPIATVWGTEAFDSDYAKAAAITDAIIRGHPFVDGNKRVGITAGCVFLTINGYHVEPSDDQIVEAAMGVAGGMWDVSKLELWFERHSS